MVRETFNGRPLVYTAALSAIVGVLVATGGNIVYFSQTSVSRQELRDDVARHQAEDHERFERLRVDLDRVTDRQIEVLRELAANEAIRDDLRLLIDDLDERVHVIEREHETARVGADRQTR